PSGVQLDTIFAYKVGMSTVYKDGVATPVTVLKYEPMVVSQVKSEETDGYQAVQVAAGPKKATRTSKSEKGHLTKSGFENGAHLIRES
ncbi:50S ribosomal protein L3, partial [bacterium LRH843]|nr:50S ribosomal protein L3 [bacterium LRH843]